MNIETAAEKLKLESRSLLSLQAIYKDPVFKIMVLLLALLTFFDSPQLSTSLVFTISSLWEMLPFFALAIGFAAFAKATNSDVLIAKAFSGNPVRSTIVAALIGAISPFCSCGVIPLIAAMLSAGVPLAAVMAFWIASPIMDPEMFILTAAGISVNFAIAKTIAAIAMGLMAGFTVLLIQRSGFLSNPLRTQINTGCASSCSAPETKTVSWKFWLEPERRQIFKSESYSISLFLGKWLTLAFFLESLMIAYVSSEWIVKYVGDDNALAIPIAAIVGAPSYLNGYAAIPLVSGLLEIGMTPGAAMAFVTAGAVSSVPAAVAVYALVKKPVFVLYISLGLFGAIVSGLVYQLSIGIN